MFKRKRQPGKDGFEEKISEVRYKVVLEALQSILNTDVKKNTADGTGATDPVLTVSAMRMKARYALDFVNGLSPDKE